MPADIPNLGAISNLGSQFTHNVFAGAQKHADEHGKKFAAQHAANVKTTEANRNRFAQSAAQGVRQGQAAHAKKQASAQNAASAAAKTMQQQRNFAHGQAIQMQNQMSRTKQTQMNYAHGQAIQQQKKMGGPASSAPSTPQSPSVVPSFSSAPAVHKPIKAQGIAATTFSSQLTPQKAVSLPNTPVSPFSHGPSQKPKSQMPSFSHAANSAPRNLTPSFSSSPGYKPVQAKKIAPTTFSSQFTPHKPMKPSTGQLGAQFSG